MFRPLALASFASFALSAAAEPPAAATVTVTPGARYEAGGLHELFFGKHYRDLWTTPLVVEVLDLRAFAGGLTPLKRGGGQQTRSLRFRGADGREYVFRSVDKDPSAVLPPELRETIAGRVLQDQISSEHPAGALVVASLLTSAGVLHAEPRLVVMPDDAALGADRKDFAGMLGFIEERGVTLDPDVEDIEKIISTSKLMERLDRDPREHVDGRAYLTARLVDVFMGDWDRHEDQWRWARLEKGKASPWVPIPRDRDQAFCRLDGLLPSLAHFFAPQLVSFRDSYPGMLGLMWNARTLDRRLLAGFTRRDFTSAAVELEGKLTDAAIESAVKRLPPELYAKDGARLAFALKRRRDLLPEAARELHAVLSTEVEVRLTAAAERVEAARLADGSVQLRAYAIGGDAEPFFSRAFDPKETGEVRVYTGGGADRVEVSPEARQAIRIRVLPPTDVVAAPKVPAPRDWGHLWLPSPWLSFGPDVGLFAGGGPILYTYGLRHDPYETRLALRGGYATQAKTFRAELTADVTAEGSARHAQLLARASGIEVLRFYGFGNETERTRDDEFYKVRQKQYTLFPSLGLPVGRDAELSFGPVAKLATTDLEDDHFITATRPYGSDTFGQAGVRAGLRYDTREEPAMARRGVYARVEASLYPAIWDTERTFGEAHAEAATYFSFAGGLEPTLALRAGGKKVWGTFPFHEAAFVGGAETVRGFSEQRFAGDASVFANAEARVFLTRFFLVLPGELGVFALVDTGRVFFAGDSSSRFHTSYGGGLWLAFLSRANAITVAVARSPERTGVYVRAGFVF